VLRILVLGSPTHVWATQSRQSAMSDHCEHMSHWVLTERFTPGVQEKIITHRTLEANDRSTSSWFFRDCPEFSQCRHPECYDQYIYPTHNRQL